MSGPAAGRGSVAGSWALVAGCATATLTWLSLTTVPLLGQRAVLLVTLGCLGGCVVTARRTTGAQRRLAALGAVVTLLPLVVVAVFLSISDG